MTTTDSNVWGGRSGYTYRFTRQPHGTTDVDAVVSREGKNLKGRVLGLLIGTIGMRKLGTAIAAKRAIMATTIMISTSVKADRIE